MGEVSGPVWCDRFPTSTAIEVLAEPFRGNLQHFMAALAMAGATIHVAATYRSPARAFLMHFACLVAGFHDHAGLFCQIEPAEVPFHPGVNIDWTHGGNVAAARDAARRMVAEYGIQYPAALVSRHTQKLAVDMAISWVGALSIMDASGVLHVIAEGPRDGTNPQLVVVGATYGVLKLMGDKPHWSSDGH